MNYTWLLVEPLCFYTFLCLQMSSPRSSQYVIAGVEVSILGELNCNVAAYPQETQAKNLLEIYNLYQYHQAINVATRITEKSAATIDLFIPNTKEINIHSKVCHIGISNHSLIYGLEIFCFLKGKPKIVKS